MKFRSKNRRISYVAPALRYLCSSYEFDKIVFDKIGKNCDNETKITTQIVQ